MTETSLAEANSNASAFPRQLRQQGLPRFDFLLGALPNKEAPTDIDLVCEKNGHFLFIEGKSPMSVGISQGQSIFYDALIRLCPERVRVLVIYGTPPDDISGYRWWKKAYHPGNAHDIRSLVRRWRDWAAQQ
jgi:hypothetical protein